MNNTLAPFCRSAYSSSVPPVSSCIQVPKRIEVHSIHTYVALYRFLPQEQNDLELQWVKDKEPVSKCVCPILVSLWPCYSVVLPSVHACTCFVCIFVPSVFCPTCCSGGMKLSAPSAEDSDGVPLRTTNNKLKAHHCCPFVPLETELCSQQGERWEDIRRDGMNVAGLSYRRRETQADRKKCAHVDVRPLKQDKEEEELAPQRG